MPTVKYRLVNPRLNPRRTRLEVPGWAGENQPRSSGSHEQPWHCIPFSEAVRAAIELSYPGSQELHVTTRGGAMLFDVVAGDGTDTDDQDTDDPDTDDQDTDDPPPPFRRFGTDFYTYQLLIDLKVEDDLAIKVETHPRFYTDTTGTVPIAVPAVLRSWWPMINFVVFKAPSEGQTHIFRPGQPFIQITIVPAESKVELVKMAEEEAAERELQSRRIYASRSTLSADTQWVSSTDTVFDGTYRRLFGAARSSRGST